ncbi:uncharacterized protein LOC106754762 [Vigna radiata var. radiata]|uniref:Uncharacterized protein LOC106754762 n=1 Tax=Vigna radiata var. radiata TaxID=3916 RepID=A0A1S3TEW2_VIGRR|nr:uncharacterized protein LOC106754762 [Vigna radiata var. radiata]
MSLGHSYSSSTCNACRRKHFRSASSSQGDGGWNKKDASLICHCGEKSVLRTAKTTKNRGKLFWSCPGYKMRSENGGCNFFKWFTDWGVEESVRCEVLEATDERLVKTFENQGVKQSFDVQKAVMGLQSWMKYLVVVVSVVFIMNMIIIAMLMGRVS